MSRPVALSLVLLVLPVLATVLGCATSSSPARVVDTPAAATADRGAAGAPPPAAPAPVAVESMEVREGAPGVYVDLAASGSLVWTSYRDNEGNLIVELPNSVPGPAVSDLMPEEGLVASITVSEDTAADRPLTRLTVRTRDEAEHSLSAEGNTLRLELMPVEQEATSLAFEPLPADEEDETEEEPVIAEISTSPEGEAEMGEPSTAPRGTPDSPMVSEVTGGAPATRLDGVEVVSAAGPTLRVMGDGAFSISSFHLTEPPRFVIDLMGVVNASPRSTLRVDSDPVTRVRIAQFKPFPEPVSRVVLDLEREAQPVIERRADGLLIHFGEAAARAEVAPTAPPAPPPTAVAATRDLEPAPPTYEEPEAEEAEMAAAPAAPSYPPPAARREPADEPPPPPLAASRPEAISDMTLFEASEVQMEPPSGRDVLERSFGDTVVASGDRVYVGEPISLSLRDADIKDVLRSFATISGINIVVQPGVSGSVTVELDSVPWDQALEQILRINGLGFELEGNIMRIARTSTLQQEAEDRRRLSAAKALEIPLKTVIKSLSYSNADQVARLLEAGRGAASRQGRGGGSILSSRGSVTVDRRTNKLIIKELPSNLNTVLAVIDNLDTPEPQVLIEARIIETTKSFTRTLGIDWSFDAVSSAALGNTTGLVFPNNGSVNGGVQLITGGRNAFLDISLGNVLGSFQIDAALQAAENEGLINILSAPRIATLNNERASIQSGLQIPIQTVANNTVSVQFVNATLQLEVTPQVTAEGTVLMDINIAKREPQLAFAVAGAANAPISTKQARTRVIVRDGGTTVIGGIYEVSTDQGEDRVPGLANVPILGHLFKNRRRTDSNEELLIFITPRVIRL